MTEKREKTNKPNKRDTHRCLEDMHTHDMYVVEDIILRTTRSELARERNNRLTGRKKLKTTKPEFIGQAGERAPITLTRMPECPSPNPNPNPNTRMPECPNRTVPMLSSSAGLGSHPDLSLFVVTLSSDLVPRPSRRIGLVSFSSQLSLPPNLRCTVLYYGVRTPAVALRLQ